MEKLKVVQISKADAAGGGASRVAEDLCIGLLKEGYESTHYTFWRGQKNPFNRTLFGIFSFPARAFQHLVKRLTGLTEIFPIELAPLFLRGIFFRYQIIHFHDLSSAYSPLSLWILSFFRPVVWTFHDCSPFTGGCLYPLGCKRFQASCGKCPQLGIWPIDSRFDTTWLNKKIRSFIFASDRIQVLAPSQWMISESMSSGLLKSKPQLIYNGVDVEQFQPLPIEQKILKRESKGIPGDRKLIVISAGNLIDERKGSKHALQIIEELRDLKPFLLLVGQLPTEFETQLQGLDYYSTGRLLKRSEIAEAYALGDCMLLPSLADNCPLTLLEGLACGLPIFGFASGGMPELVDQGQTGYLVPIEEGRSLALELRAWLKSAEKMKSAQALSRSVAVDRFSSSSFLNNHIELYRELARAH